ncbi:MAG TPA: hypothetical protein GX507_00070 [Clostridia bacterium]|nr:hypothetical protein [Clostridia bacterium]
MAKTKEGRLSRYVSKTHPAVIAVWAALIAVAGLLPSIPILGTGGTFSIAVALVPLAGVLFGPISGAICGAIGGFIGQLIAPHTAWLGLGTFVIGTVNAFVSGLVSRRNWWLPTLIILIGLALWFTNPIGQQVPMFAIVVYGLGIIVSLIGGFFAEGFLKGANVFLKGVGVWLASFSGMIAAAAIGNYLGLVIIKIPADVWKFLIPVTPTERTIFSIGAAIIGVPLLIGLPKIGVYVGPMAEEEEEED